MHICAAVTKDKGDYEFEKEWGGEREEGEGENNVIIFGNGKNKFKNKYIVLKKKKQIEGNLPTW